MEQKENKDNQPATLPTASEQHSQSDPKETKDSGTGNKNGSVPSKKAEPSTTGPPASKEQDTHKIFTVGSTDTPRPEYQTQKSYGSVTFADDDEILDSMEDNQGCCYRCMNRLFPYGFKSELKELFVLAWPMVLVCLSNMMIPFVAVLFCGHLGTEELDAVSLANSLINVTGLSVGMGLATACDTLFSQTFGSANKKRVGVYLQKAILILFLFCFPCWAIHLNTESLLLVCGQNVDVARLAGNYLLWFMPGLFFNFMFQGLSKYINNQNIVIPSVLIGLLANGVNILAHYIFIYVLGWGTEGSALSQVLSYFTMAVGTLIYILVTKVYEDTWDGWSKESLDDWACFMKLALPGMLMVCLEWWCFEIGTILTGVLSKLELGAQSIMFQLETISYVIPVGIAIAVSIRVGQHLGSNDPRGAMTSSRVSLLIIWISAIIMGALYAGLRNYLPRAFTSDENVIARAAGILPILSLFQLFDGIAGVCGGVLRGCGRQVVGAVVIFIGYYVLALPIGIPLMFLTPLKIEGLWISYAGGIAIEGLCFLILVLTTNWKFEAMEAQLRAGITEEDAGIQDDDEDAVDEKSSLLPTEFNKPAITTGSRRFSSPNVVGSTMSRRYSSSRLVTVMHGRRFSTPGKPKSMPDYPRRYSSPYLAQYQEAIEDKDQVGTVKANIARTVFCLILCIGILVAGLLLRLFVKVPLTPAAMCLPDNSTSSVTGLPPCSNFSQVAAPQYNLNLFQASTYGY